MEKYDLEERTAKFGEIILKFSKKLSQDAVTRSVISQLARAATSIGANYMEANNASSKNDFRNKIFICKKEASEVKYWLKMINVCFPESGKDILRFSQECQELVLIFQKIVSSMRH